MSKFCTYCGKELNDNANFCTSCGAAATDESRVNIQKNTDEHRYTNYNENNNLYDSGLFTAAKILCVLNCVAFAFLVFPLMWMIPITIEVFNRSNTTKPMSTTLKICVLVFVSRIAGILLLCDEKA